MPMSFHGYCFDQHGRYLSPAVLKGPAEVYQFCELNKEAHYEVRIVEPLEDAVVVQTIGGKYVFPDEWQHFNNR